VNLRPSEAAGGPKSESQTVAARGPVATSQSLTRSEDRRQPEHRPLAGALSRSMGRSPRLPRQGPAALFLSRAAAANSINGALHPSRNELEGRRRWGGRRPPRSTRMVRKSRRLSRAALFPSRRGPARARGPGGLTQSESESRTSIVSQAAALAGRAAGPDLADQGDGAWGLGGGGAVGRDAQDAGGAWGEGGGE
jgi:hypothetical protein